MGFTEEQQRAFKAGFTDAAGLLSGTVATKAELCSMSWALTAVWLASNCHAYSTSDERRARACRRILKLRHSHDVTRKEWSRGRGFVIPRGTTMKTMLEGLASGDVRGGFEKKQDHVLQQLEVLYEERAKRTCAGSSNLSKPRAGGQQQQQQQQQQQAAPQQAQMQNAAAVPVQQQQQDEEDEDSADTVPCQVMPPLSDFPCSICGREAPPSLPAGIDTYDWTECGHCTSWYHTACLNPEGWQQATGEAWCPTCEQRAREDAVGLGNFAQHTAGCYNSTLQQIGARDVLSDAGIPRLKLSNRSSMPGMVAVVVERLLKECDLECASLGSSSISLMGMLGASGKGKTLIANSLMLGCSGNTYLPDAPSLAPDKLTRLLLKQLKSCGFVKFDDTTVWSPQQDNCTFGKAAFSASGFLLEAERQQLLAADAAAQRGLVEALISGQQQQASKQQGWLLPVFQQGREIGVTSCQNVVVMKGSRLRVLMLPYTSKLLHRAVMACKQEEQAAGYLDEQAEIALEVSRQTAAYNPNWCPILYSFAFVTVERPGLASRLITRGNDRPGECAMLVSREMMGAAAQQGLQVPDDNYVVCALCTSVGPPQLHCRGCHISAHSKDVPLQERPGPGQAWWCRVCTKRGLGGTLQVRHQHDCLSAG